MPTIISGPDAQVLYLHQEMRSWKQRGVAFTLANDGTISILSESREEIHEAQKYRSQHAEALRRYLAFVDGRDPDDAIRHLEFAWDLRGECVRKESAMSTDIWLPEPLVRARRRRIELAAEVDSIEERRAGARRGLDELNARWERKKEELQAVESEIKELERKV